MINNDNFSTYENIILKAHYICKYDNNYDEIIVTY